MACRGKLVIEAVAAEGDAAGLDIGDDGGCDRTAVVHHIRDRLTDDVVQRQHDQQRNERPETSAAHRNAFVLVKLLKRKLIFLLVIAVFCLECLGKRRKTRHFQHALLALDAHREQHELDDEGEQDQRHAVVVYKPVEPVEQDAERDADDVREGHFVLCGVERLLRGLRRLKRGAFVVGSRSVHGAAGQREDHEQCEEQCKESFHLLSSKVGMPGAGHSPCALRHRIKVVTLVKRMAPQKPPYSQNAAFPCAVLCDGLQCILGARRRKPAAGRKGG